MDRAGSTDDKTLTRASQRRKPDGSGFGKHPTRPIYAFMTDSRRTPDPISRLFRLTPGTLVVFRHYEATDRLSLGVRLRRLARHRRLPFLVAGDAQLARRLRADGLHLPGYQVSRSNARKGRRIAGMVTAAAHDKRSAWQACHAGVDLVLLSPVFATASHPGRQPMGILHLAALVRALPRPVLAMGGIDHRVARRVLKTGVRGIAGIAGIARLSRDPFALRAGS